MCHTSWDVQGLNPPMIFVMAPCPLTLSNPWRLSKHDSKKTQNIMSVKAIDYKHRNTDTVKIYHTYITTGNGNCSIQLCKTGYYP